MFDLQVTLNPTAFGGANVDKVYDHIGLGTEKSSSVRRVGATITTTPETLSISHRESKQGAVTYDQHLVRMDKTFTDPIAGLVTLSSWLVIRVPRGTTVVTEQEIKDMVGRLLAFEQAAGSLTKILNSEP